MKWTNQETSILKDNYNVSLQELSLLLPNRTIASIGIKKSKLGILKNPNWTEKEINILEKHGSDCHTKDLIKLLPNRSLNAIRGMLSTIKIKKSKIVLQDVMRIARHSEKYKIYLKLDQTLTIDNLSNSTYQVLIGSMLGDGSVYPKGKQYVFGESHCYAQADYLRWKQNMLSVFSPTINECKKSIQMTTPGHNIFNQIRKDWYDEIKCEKTYIHNSYIPRIDELGLLIWYLDDGNKGSVFSPGIKSICFSKNDLDFLIQSINKKYKMSLSITENTFPSRGKSERRIVFNAENRDKIMPIFKNLFKQYNIPICMEYKIKKPTI